MPHTQNGRVAVYLDFDNIVLSWYDQVHGRNSYARDRQRIAEDPTNAETAARLDAAIVDVGAIIDYASSFGTLVLTRAYADWSAPMNAYYRQQLVARAVDLVQLFPAAAYAKNGADIRLAVDTVEDMFRLDDLTHVVIVAGDSDYVPLAQRCKRLGRYVVGIGVAGSTAKALTAACDEFATYDSLPGVEAPVREQRPRRNRREKAAPGGEQSAPSAPPEPSESGEPAEGAEAPAEGGSGAQRAAAAPSRSGRSGRSGRRRAGSAEGRAGRQEAPAAAEGAESAPATAAAGTAEAEAAEAAEAAELVEAAPAVESAWWADADDTDGFDSDFDDFGDDEDDDDDFDGDDEDEDDAELAVTGLLIRALWLGQEKDDSGWLHSSAVKQQMRRMDPSFSEKALGFRSFSDFLKSRSDVAELEETGHERLVRLRDQGE